MEKKKIINFDDLIVISEELLLKKKKVVLCHGVFDLLHLGHIKYFKEAKSFGDILIVTLTQDEYVKRGYNRPVFKEMQRAEAIASLEVVDYVAVNKWPTAIRTIELLKPSYYVKGPDYKDPKKDITGNITLEEDAIKSVGGKMKFTNDITFSSTNLINNNISLYTKEQDSFIKKIKSKYNFNEVISYFDKMKQKKLFLIGETIIDEYIACNVLGKAGKDPILTLQKLEGEKYPGGILSIANHLSEFCKSIKVVSYLGNNKEYDKYVQKSLKKGIDFKFVRKTGSPTIIKRRYVDNEKKNKIIGVYDINDELINGKEEKLLTKLINQTNDCDVTVVADYGHGLLTPKTIDAISRKSSFLCINTQLNSANIGFHTISKYKSADYICMHEGELRHDFRSRQLPVEDLTKNLYERVKASLVTVTQGARGAICYEEKKGFQYSPAFANKVIDKVGAGDTLFALTSLCFSVKMPQDLTLLLGNFAGAEAVASIGNSKSLEKNSLLKTVESIFK